MRQAGTLTSKTEAQRFANYLLSLGITSKVDPAGEAWAIWIHDENQIPRSKQELEQFERDPQDGRYLAAEKAAKLVRKEEAEKRKQFQKNYVEMRDVWNNPARRRPVTMTLIIASALATSGLLEGAETDLKFNWPLILEGQIWRLITPIFLHGDILHLIFNMWWLFDLGGMIEPRLKTFRYVLMVLSVALVSNMTQFIAVGPDFVGMSGVVLGLFGYAWVRGRLDPTSGLYLRPDVVFWMMGFFVLCWLNIIGNVANWAHGAGLAMGAAIGYLPELRRLLR
jgi:GlpG protein